MAETYIEMFREEHYPGIFQEMAEWTIRQFEANEIKIIESMEKVMRGYLEQIASLQAGAQAPAVAEMEIAFLYTSLNEGKSRFRLDCYGEGGRVLGESISSAYLSADWLTAGLEELVVKLRQCAEKEHLRRYIREAELEVLKLRAARSLLGYFAGRMKYILREALDMGSLAKVKKESSFAIQFGEYMDWHKTLYAILPEVDVFNCDRETELRFRDFPAILYQEKRFAGLLMDQARFKDCTFTRTVIENCRMNDCLFDRCTFDNVEIINTSMAGCIFQKCTFNGTSFDRVVFYGSPLEGYETEYFQPAEFYECSLEQGHFKGCVLTYCMTQGCQAQDVTITGSNVEYSGFWDMDGIEITE